MEWPCVEPLCGRRKAGQEAVICSPASLDYLWSLFPSTAALKVTSLRASGGGRTMSHPKAVPALPLCSGLCTDATHGFWFLLVLVISVPLEAVSVWHALWLPASSMCCLFFLLSLFSCPSVTCSLCLHSWLGVCVKLCLTLRLHA